MTERLVDQLAVLVMELETSAFAVAIAVLIPPEIVPLRVAALDPVVALLLTSLYAMVVLGLSLGRSASGIASLTGASFAPVAGILLIVGAGGGFKQTLVDSGVGTVIGTGIVSVGIPVLVAGWLVAVLIRVSTGSATVATITASGIMAPLAVGLPPRSLRAPGACHRCRFGVPVPRE